MDAEVTEEPMVIAQYVRRSDPRIIFQREYLDTSPSSTDLRKRLQPAQIYEKSFPLSKCTISTQTERDNIPDNGDSRFYLTPASRTSSTGRGAGGVFNGPSSFSSQNCSIEKFSESSISEVPLKPTAAVIEVSPFDDVMSVDNGCDSNLEKRESVSRTKFSCIPLRFIKNYDASHPKFLTKREILNFDSQQPDQSHVLSRTSNNTNNDAYSNTCEISVNDYAQLHGANQNSYSITNHDDTIPYHVPYERRNVSYVEQKRSSHTQSLTEKGASASYFVNGGNDGSYSSRGQHDKAIGLHSHDRLINDSDSISVHDKNRYCVISTQPTSDSIKMKRSDSNSSYYGTRPENDDLHHAQMLYLNRQLSKKGHDFSVSSAVTNEFGIRSQNNDNLNVNSEFITRSSFSNPRKVPALKPQLTGVSPHVEQNIYDLTSENLHPVQRQQNDEDRLVHQQLCQMRGRIQSNCPDFQRQMTRFEMIKMKEGVSAPQGQEFELAPRSQTRVLAKDSVSLIPNDVQNSELLSTERVIPKPVQRFRNDVYHMSSIEMHAPRPVPFLPRQMPQGETGERVYVLQREVPVNSVPHREQLSDFMYSPERDMNVEAHLPETLKVFKIGANPVEKQVSILRPVPRNSYSYVTENASLADGSMLMDTSMPVYTRVPERLVSKNFQASERLRAPETDGARFQRNALASEQAVRDGCHSIRTQIRRNVNIGIAHESHNSDYFSTEVPRTNDRASKLNLEIPISTSKSGPNVPHAALRRTSSASNLHCEGKIESFAPNSCRNFKASPHTHDGNMYTADFNPREKWEAANQNYGNFFASDTRRNEKIDNFANPARDKFSSSYLDPKINSSNTGSAPRKSTEIQAPLLQRALEEPLNSGRMNFLPTVLADFSSTNSYSESKPESHRSNSQSSAHSDCIVDWTDEEEHETGTALKRVQHCTFCRNHGVSVRKYGHVCERKACECLLCKLTLHSQDIMKQQQALWRRQNKEFKGTQLRGVNKEKLCDKCRNHNEVREKRGHSSACRYDLCHCEPCKLTDKRRRVTKYLQRIRRAKVTSEEMDMIWREMNDQQNDPPLESETTRIDRPDQACGQPVQQFISCLVPDSMSQSEIRHFLYPRPHLTDEATDKGSNSVFNERNITGVYRNERGIGAAVSLRDKTAGENSTAHRYGMYPMKDQKDYRQANNLENSHVNTSFKHLCMAEKKKIVEGKNGNFREFLSYGERLRENSVSSSDCTINPTIGEDASSGDVGEAVAQAENSIAASSISESNCGRSSIRSELSEQTGDTDNIFEIAEKRQPFVLTIDDGTQLEELMNDVDNKNPTSQDPVMPDYKQLAEHEKSLARRSYVKRRKRKRTQSCTFCQNHGFTIPKPSHKCPYGQCECLLCRLTKLARVVMKHQQALWRHQARELKKTPLGSLTKLRQVCDKCRNHNQLYKKSGHTACAFEKCTCPLCTLTDKRRYVMMHLQRIRRAQVTVKALSSSKDEDSDGGKMNKSSNPEHQKLDRDDESHSVAEVINNVTRALRALPPSLQRLSSELDIAHEPEADLKSSSAHDEMEVSQQDPNEDNPMEMEGSVSDTWQQPTLTQL